MMKARRWLPLAGVSSVLTLTIFWNHYHRSPVDHGRPTGPVLDAGAAKAQWNDPEPERSPWTGFTPGDPATMPDLADVLAFDGWVSRWETATASEREAMVEEGRSLAERRRQTFKALIAVDPETALKHAVPRQVSASLPASISAHLEVPVSAAGQFDVRWTCTCGGPATDDHATGAEHRSRVDRIFVANGARYNARVTPALHAMRPRPSAPLQGVAIDEEMAVAPNAVRVLDPGESLPPGVTAQPLDFGENSASTGDGAALVEIAGNYYSIESAEDLTRLTRDFEEWALFEYNGSNAASFFKTNYPTPTGKRLGSYKLLYIRVAHSDSLSTAHTEESTLLQMRELERLYGDWSYGKFVLTSTLAPLVTAPSSFINDNGTRDAGPISDFAQAEVRKMGYDPSQYDTVVILGDGIGGVAFGNTAATGGRFSTLVHEMGHRIGAWHSGTWITQDGTSYGFPGANPEPETTEEQDWRYGNSFDVMGDGAVYRDGGRFNVGDVIRLGWLAPGEFHQADRSGTYRIHAYDQNRLEHGKQYGFVARKNAVKNYYLEFRAGLGGVLSESALLLVGGPSENRLVDTTPETPMPRGWNGGKRNLGISLGQTFSDLEADMHLTVIGRNSTTPPSLDVVYQKGPFPGNVAPQLDAVVASAAQVPVGGSITFDASTATDANGDTLAYHWEFDDGVRVGNQAVVTRSFATAAQVTAMVTVSDMKGGRVRRHVVVTAGNPGRQVVTGTVALNGQPLEHVRISASNGQFAYTDRSGNYALANLPAGDTTLTAILNGHAFEASRANPVNVAAGANVVDWQATRNRTFVTLEKIADAVEGGANGTFRFTRDGDTSADLVVRVSNPGSQAAAGDYSMNPAAVATTGAPNNESFLTFTIPAGQATLDVSVTATNDTAAEGPESIDWHLNHNGNYLLDRASAVRMTIVDNDTALPQVAVAAADRFASEGASDPGSFTFTRTGPTGSALDLSLAWSGTATNGTDFPLLPPVVTIPAGQSAVTVSFQPVQDGLAEGTETITATVAASPAYIIRPGASSAVIDIADADIPVVSVSVATAEAHEAGEKPGLFMIHRTGPVAAPLTVYYGVRGTALHGRDYQPLTGEVVIPAGARSAPALIAPVDDSDTEGREEVELLLASAPAAYSVGSSASGKIFIVDDETLPVISVRPGPAGTEGQGNASVIFRAVGGVPGEVTVRYTVSGSATSGSDFSVLAGELVLPIGGIKEVTLSIPVIDDEEVETSERVKITLQQDPAYVLEHGASTEVLIHDNDSGPVRVGVGPQAGGRFPSENNPASNRGRMRFVRTGPTDEELVVDYQVGGTATNGVDYDELPGTVTIPAGSRHADVTFTPVDDALGEGLETVEFTVLPGDGYSPTPWEAGVLEITDNDPLAPTIGFVERQTLVSEVPGAGGGILELEVRLSAASAQPVTVEVAGGTGSTATGDNVDWALLDGAAVVSSIPLHFPAGVTSRTIRLKVVEDGIREETEAFTIALRRPTGGSLSSTHAVHEVMIFDGPVPPAAELVTEERWNGTAVYNNNAWSGSAPAHSRVLLNFTPERNVGDNYSRRMSGVITAPATGDYTFWIASDDASKLFIGTSASPESKVQRANVSGWTGFQSWTSNASQRSQPVALVAGQQYYVEVQHLEAGGDDHVSVAWEGPGFARRELSVTGGSGSLPVLRFASERSTRSEGDGNEPGLVVYLDRPAGASGVTASLHVSGSATAGQDYVLETATVTFQPGETTRHIPLAVIADGLAEGPEWLSVSLSQPVGAMLGSPAAHRMTLSDAGAPAIETLWTEARSIMESGTDLGGLVVHTAPGLEITRWAIIAGNTGGAFAISPAGRLTLVNPDALPDPGGVQLLVRATDSAGSTGDGVVKVICNAMANGVLEERWNGTAAYAGDAWTDPQHTGMLASLTTPQGIGDNYSRRLVSYLKPQVSGDYHFTIAGDDDCRLLLSTDASAANAVQIAAVAGWTPYQSWTSQPGQRSVAIPLVAGRYYRIEARQREITGGDHVSVAWEGPGIARQAIPSTVLFTPRGVLEQRWNSTLPYSLDDWSGPPTYTGNLATFTTPQGVGSNYSRRLTGYLRPTVGGEYTFWIAGDDDSRLYIADDPSSTGMREIAAVAGATGFQSWDQDQSSIFPRQKSSPVTLVAGRLYRLEVQQVEYTGNDHVSVAWQRAGGARETIPHDQIIPAISGLDLDTPLAAPAVVLSAPATPMTMTAPQELTLMAEVLEGTLPVTSVSFFQGSTLIATDETAPYSAVWNGTQPGAFDFFARAHFAGGSVESAPVTVTLLSGDPAADADGDGFTTGLELALGTNPYDASSQPASHHAGMIGWWRMDEGSGSSVDDSTGRPQDGTVTGATWIQRDAGHALQFDGVDDSVSMPAGLLGNRASFTMSGWYRTSRSNGNRLGLWGQNDVVEFGIQGTNLSLWTPGGGSVSTPLPARNQWHHVACVGDGLSLKIYVDGVLAATGGSPTGNYGNSAHPFRIGGGGIWDNTGNHFNGRIDDVRLFDRALSAAEIQAVRSAPLFRESSLSIFASEGQAAQGQLQVENASSAGSLTFSKISGPAWLTVATNGALSGTPGQPDIGRSTAVVRVENASGHTAEGTLDIEVNGAPTFTASEIRKPPTTPATVYAATLAGDATDPEGDPLRFSKLSGPAWLVVAPGGALGGQPSLADVGDQWFIVRVEDPHGASSTALLMIQVGSSLAYPADSYGTLVGTNVSDEFIQRVRIADLDHESGSNGGYGDFRTMVARMDPGQTVTYTLTPGWTGNQYREAWSVWIDLNRDGDFDDAGEMVVQLDGARTERSGSFSLPASASRGGTRMRVAMKYLTPQAQPTGSYQYGEVEDYSVQVGPPEVPNASPYFLADPIVLPPSGSLAGLAADWEGDPLVFELLSGPSWLQVSPSGALTGVPPEDTTVESGFVVRVTDSHGGEDTAVLRVLQGPAGYSAWALLKGLEGGDSGFEADPDGDGIANGLEFALGGEPHPGHPESDSRAFLPVIGIEEGDMVFTFHRPKVAREAVALHFQWSGDLDFEGAVRTLPIRSGYAVYDGVEMEVLESISRPGTDWVRVVVPREKATAGRLFGRIRVSP